MIYGYQLTPSIAEKVGVDIPKEYNWIDSAWVDCDTIDRTTLKLETTPEFQSSTDTQRHTALDILVDQVVNAVRWDFGRKPLHYIGIQTR